MFFILSAEAQSTNRKITLADGSLSPNEIQAINPILLDTIYEQTKDGNLSMKIEVAKNLDTAFVQHPETGDIQMVVTRKKSTPVMLKPTAHKKGDTIYVEDPVTLEIKRVIVK